MKEQAEKQQTQQSAPNPGEQSSSTPALQPNSKQNEQQQGRSPDEEQKEQYGGMKRRDWLRPSMWTENPVAMMRRFTDEMDRFFEEFGFRRGWLGSRWKQERELG